MSIPPFIHCFNQVTNIQPEYFYMKKIVPPSLTNNSRCHALKNIGVLGTALGLNQ